MVAVDVRPSVNSGSNPENFRIVRREDFARKFGEGLAQVSEAYCSSSRFGYVETDRGLMYQADVRDEFAFSVVGEMDKQPWNERGPWLSGFLSDLSVMKPNRKYFGEIAESANDLAGSIDSQGWQERGPYFSQFLKGREIVNK